MIDDVLVTKTIEMYAKKRANNEAEELKRILLVNEQAPMVAKLIEKRRKFLLNQLHSVVDKESSGISNAESKISQYNKEIKKALAENGFSEDFLQPIYECKLCKDTGYIKDPLTKRCSCFSKVYERAQAEQKSLKGNISPSFKNYDRDVFSNKIIPELKLTQREYMEKIKKKIYDYANTFPYNSKPDMLFVGKSGLGKTFLLQALDKKIKEKGYDSIYMTSYKFIEVARQAHFLNQSEMLEPIINCDLLLIDDLGVEPMMENITIVQLFRVIDERQRAGKSIVLSTNLNSNEIKDRYTERIASRLLNFRRSEIIAFVGEDIRINKEL